ncbi:MAG: bacteriohemerythrin [bacterium]|jgi:hemerythrin-like metal-binding protein|nr:bacteriohemerythrin [bacterium]
MAQAGWKAEYATGIQQIDEQHQRLFELLEQLYDAIHQGQGRAESQERSVLEALVLYARTHFRCEEDLMRRHFYPGVTAHVEEHGKLVISLAEQVDLYKRGRLAPLKLALFIRDWIVNHMLDDDQRAGAHLRSRGLR